MKKTRGLGFGASAMLLALGGLVCKIIGALYRIPLTNVLGAEGMGAYQTVFPVFTVLLTISSGGITQTVSALISGSEEEGREDRGILKAGFLDVIILSLGLGIFMFIFAPFLSSLQGSPVSSAGYKLLSPVLLLSGLSAVFKGYYQAKSNVFPTFFSSLIEQVAKLVFGLGLSVYLAQKGVEYALFGAFSGVLIAELFSFIFLSLRFLFGKDKPIRSDFKNPEGYDFYRIFRSVLPLSIGGLILPLTSFFDSISVINILSRTLGDSALATALYGLLSGTVSTLVNLPVVFTVALGVTVIPALSREKSANALSVKATLSVKLALFVCLPLSLLMIVLASPIMDILYPALSLYERRVSAALLGISALGIPALGITQIYSSLLFSVGASGRATRNLAIAAVVKCIFSIPAIYFFGIYGAAGATALCYFVSAILNTRTWRKLFGEKDCVLKTTAVFLSLSTIIAVPLFFISKSVNVLLLCGLSAVCVLLYLYTSIKSGVFSSDELKSLPFGKRLARYAKKE